MRLPWWVFVVALAAEGALLLPPSSTPPEWAWWAPARDTLRTPLEGRVAALQGARALAAWRAELARSEAALRPWLNGPGGAVLVLDKTSDGRLALDRERTAAAESLWALLPARDPRVRTLVLPEQVSVPPAWRPQGGHGVCLARWMETHGVWSRRGEVGERLSYCAFVSEFGPPGAGMRQWAELATPAWPPVEWFKGAWSEPWAAHDDDPRWTPSFLDLLRSHRAPLSRYAGTSMRAADRVACQHGRGDRCLPGYGLAELPGGAAPVWSEWVGFSPPLLGLLQALGPERFAELWRSEAPVPEAYAAVTGGSLAEWLTGRDPGRDRGRTPPREDGRWSWLGAAVWGVLLSAWAVARLRPARVVELRV